MSRLSIVVLTENGDDSEVVKRFAAGAEEHRIAFRSIALPWSELLAEVSTWAILPEVIVIDLPDHMEAFRALDDLSERMPDGVGDVIMTSVPNDIHLYRGLKSRGVAEIFPAVPEVEDVSRCIDEIVTREMRSTGIDARRAVYVWSCSGGSGGTTFALAFARHFSNQGRRTLLIDMDIFSAPASYMYSARKGASETTGLMEALASPGRVDAIFLERVIQAADKNLFYLSARRRASDPDPQASALSEIIARAQKNFDMVVIDTPWRANPEPEYGKVNGTSYLVAAPTATSLLGFATLIKEISTSPTKAPMVGILNREGEYRSNDISLKMFRDAAGTKEVLVYPYDAASTGGLFFNQKTLADLGGKPKKRLARILASLPSHSRSQAGTTPGSPVGPQVPAVTDDTGLIALRQAEKTPRPGLLSMFHKRKTQ